MEDKFCKDCKYCFTYKLIPFIGPTVHMCTHPAVIETDKINGKIIKKYSMCSYERGVFGFCLTPGYAWEKK